jgi:hypothetical protein
MDRDAILEYARRNRTLVAEAKTAFWQDGKRGRSAADILTTGDQLLRHVQALRPGWPSEADRAADVASHQRVAEALHAASRRVR